MNGTKMISIKGSFKKDRNLWISHVPLISVGAQGLNPENCLKGLKRMIQSLSGDADLNLEIKVSDNNLIVLSSPNPEMFLEFLKDRIRKNNNHEVILERLGEYIGEC